MSRCAISYIHATNGYVMHPFFFFFSPFCIAKPFNHSHTSSSHCHLHPLLLSNQVSPMTLIEKTEEPPRQQFRSSTESFTTSIQTQVDPITGSFIVLWR